ncbi:MAG: hypothetical protein ACE5KJ_08735, partial [Candidatus Zixiibacteriota bacterium]
MKRAFYIWIWFFLLLASTNSQVLRKPSFQPPKPIVGLAGNSIGDIKWDGNQVWVGTGSGLSKSIGGGDTVFDWYTYKKEHGLGEDGISTVTVAKGEVWVSTSSGTSDRPIGNGISMTENEGDTWLTLTPDETVGPGNIAWDIALTDTAIWAACWNGYGQFDGGLIKSSDGGQTWETVIPTTEKNGQFTFAVLIDSSDIWVGTAAGISKSTDGGQSWVTYNSERDGITGNWVFSFGVQRLSGGKILWACTWPTGENESYGVSKTEDGGATWTTCDSLNNIQAIDFAFQDSVVWVATFRGLKKSSDGGRTWETYTTEQGLASNEVTSVEIADGVIWVGTTDGLNRSKDDGKTWELIRTSSPTARLDLKPTYAFPNPFSPFRHQFVRIRYSISSSDRVTIKIFDFAMDEVITLVAGEFRQG